MYVRKVSATSAGETNEVGDVYAEVVHEERFRAGREL
jgi:hypothetical protein